MRLHYRTQHCMWWLCLHLFHVASLVKIRRRLENFARPAAGSMQPHSLEGQKGLEKGFGTCPMAWGLAGGFMPVRDVDYPFTLLTRGMWYAPKVVGAGRQRQFAC